MTIAVNHGLKAKTTATNAKDNAKGKMEQHIHDNRHINQKRAIVCRCNRIKSHMKQITKAQLFKTSDVISDKMLKFQIYYMYSCLSLSRPRLSRPYHLCRTDVRVPYISPIYLLYFNFACLELLLSRHIGYLAHHFRSVDIFFT